MADSFTWLEKFGDVCAMLDVGDRKELVYAIAMYGMYGEEPELPFHLSLAFAAMREDVDYSKKRRSTGAKGGRPKAHGKAPAKAAVDYGETRSEDAGNAPENHRENVSENVTENVGENPKQSRAEQSNAKQGSVEGRASRFAPPTADEVSAYAAEKGIDVDAERFVDFYASKGWRVGSAPMKDWRAAARNWARRRADERKEQGDEAPVFREW